MANKEPIVDIYLKSGATITIEEDLNEINCKYTYIFFKKVIDRLKDISFNRANVSGSFTYDNVFIMLSEISAITFSEVFLKEIDNDTILSAPREYYDNDNAPKYKAINIGLY